MTNLRVSFASLHVSSSRLLSWKAKQITCCTRATMSLLHSLQVPTVKVLENADVSDSMMLLYRTDYTGRCCRYVLLVT